MGRWISQELISSPFELNSKFAFRGVITLMICISKYSFFNNVKEVRIKEYYQSLVNDEIVSQIVNSWAVGYHRN